MALSFRFLHVLPPLVLALASLALSGCDARSSEKATSDTAGPAPRLRIVQPKPNARIPLWEEARQLGKVKILFDVGSTPVEATGRGGYRLLTRTDSRPATEVHDVHTALIRKPHVGKHVLHAWLVDEAGQVVVETSVPFEVLGAAKP